MAPIERLLVRLPNWLGDVLLARPLLHALARAFPSAERRAVAPEALARLLAAEPAVSRWDAWPGTGRGRSALARELEAWRPSAALILPPSFSSAWFARVTSAPLRVGYAGDWRSGLLTHALPRVRRGDLHLSREYLALGRVLGAGDAEAPPLGLPPGAAAAAAAIVRASGIGDGPYAVVGPGAIYGPAKQWPADRFAELGRELARDGLAVLVSGTPAERELCEGVARAIGARARSIAGATDLPSLAGLLAGARVAVCNDSGLAHLSAALGTSTVVIFGSTSSAWTAPLGPRVRVLQHAPVCSPCFRRTCRIGYRCLVAVSAAEAARACREDGRAVA